MLTDSVRGPALYGRLQAYIKGYIFENNLKPGDPLPPEGELAARLGVSRGSIREAIKALEALGVIEVQHGTGIFVRGLNLDAILNVLSYNLDFDPATVGELLQLRKWLEAAVIGDIIREMDEPALHEAEEILAGWRNLPPGADWEAFDRRFHQVLNDVLDNRVLSLLMDAFWAAFNGCTDEAIKSEPDREATWTEHRQILDAVKAGDVAGARQAVLISYADVEQRIARSLRGKGPGL